MKQYIEMFSYSDYDKKIGKKAVIAYVSCPDEIVEKYKKDGTNMYTLKDFMLSIGWNKYDVDEYGFTLVSEEVLRVRKRVMELHFEREQAKFEAIGL